MFNFKKQDLISEAVDEAIGSRQKYIGFIKEYTLTKEDKETLLQASISVKKKDPNKKIVAEAHAVMVKVGAISEKQSLIQEETLVYVGDYAKQNGLNPKVVIEKIKAGELAGKIHMQEWFVDVALSKEMSNSSTRLKVEEQEWFEDVTLSEAKDEEATKESVSKKETLRNEPRGIKFALYSLSLSLMLGIVVGLFAILSMILHANASHLASSVFAYIGLIIAVNIVLSWYIIKAIVNGVKWVKTAYLIFVFISLFTFFPTLDSISWMKGIYRFNFVTQEILAIFASIGLLLPSSSNWFESVSMKKQDNSKASAIYESAIQAIKRHLIQTILFHISKR